MLKLHGTVERLFLNCVQHLQEHWVLWFLVLTTLTIALIDVTVALDSAGTVFVPTQP